MQDQVKLGTRVSITPGIRYDWQNFLATDRLGFSPRFSFAWVVDPKSKTIVRGGGALYYDRFGSSALLDLVRYETARRRSIVISLDPASLPASGCVPISECVTVSAQPPNLVQLMPNAKLPYEMEYGLSLERQLGERGTATVSGYSLRAAFTCSARSMSTRQPSSRAMRSGQTRRMDASGKCNPRVFLRAAVSTSRIAGGSTSTSPASAATPGPTTNRTRTEFIGFLKTSSSPRRVVQFQLRPAAPVQHVRHDPPGWSAQPGRRHVCQHGNSVDRPDRHGRLRRRPVQHAP